MRAALAAVGVLLVSCAPALAGDPVSEDPLVVSLEIEAERRVSALQVDQLRRDFQLAFARIECPVRLLSLADDASLEPELVLALHVERWRERNTPGGRPIFDPSTGQERPGFKREIEVRFTIRVREPAAEEPLYEKERRVRRSRGTTASLAYDPVILARRDASEWVIRESLRPLCREAKKLHKSRN